MEISSDSLGYHIVNIISGRNVSEANTFFMGILAVPSSWQAMIQLIDLKNDPNVAYFATNLFYTKCKTYWKHFSPEEREEILQLLLSRVIQFENANKILRNRIILAVCCLAPRVPQGINKLYQTVTPELYQLTSLDHTMLCLKIIESIPEECESMDLSRSSKTEIFAVIYEFSKLLMKALSSWLAMLQTNQQSLLPIVLCGYQALQPYVPKSVTISQIYDEYNSIVEQGWTIAYQIGSKASGVLLLIKKLVVNKEVSNPSRNSAIVFIFGSLIQHFDVSTLQFGNWKIDCSDEGNDLINIILEMTEAEIGLIARHESLAPYVMNIILSIYASSRQTSLSSIDIILAIGDIPSIERHECLRLDIFQQILQASIKLSIYPMLNLQSDENDEITEYRDSDVGCVDVLRLAFDSLGIEMYLQTLYTWYQQELSNILGSDSLRIHEVVMFYHSIVADFVEEVQEAVNSSIYQAFLSQMLDICCQDISSQAANQYLASKLLYISKVSRIAHRSNNSQIYFNHCLNLASKYIFHPDLYIRSSATKALSAILTSWALAYISTLPTLADKLSCVMPISNTLFQCVDHNIRYTEDHRSVLSNLKSEVFSQSISLFPTYLRLVNNLDDQVRRDVIVQILTQISTVTQQLSGLPMNMGSISYNVCLICINHVLRVFGEVLLAYNSDFSHHTVQLVTYILGLAVTNPSFISSESAYTSFADLLLEVLILIGGENTNKNALSQFVRDQLQSIISLSLSKLMTSSCQEILSSFRILSALTALGLQVVGQSSVPGQYSDYLSTWQIFTATIDTVSRTANVQPGKSGLEVTYCLLDNSSEAVEAFFGYMTSVLANLTFRQCYIGILGIGNQEEEIASLSPQIIAEMRSGFASSVSWMLSLSARALKSYSEESLLRSILRAIQALFEPIALPTNTAMLPRLLSQSSLSRMGAAGMVVLVADSESIRGLIDDTVLTLMSTCLLDTSSSLRRSLAVDVLGSIVPTFQQIDSNSVALENLLTGALLHRRDVVDSSIGKIEVDSVFDSNTANLIAKHLVQLASLCSPSASLIASEAFLGKSRRKLRNFCDDIGRVWNRELDIEAILESIG